MTYTKDFMPISIDVRSRKVLILGGGKQAYEKLRNLQNYTSNILVIDRHITDEIKLLGVDYIEKDYETSDIYDSFLVYAYTDNMRLNLKIKQDCESSGKLVNVLNNPELGDFESPVVFKKSNMSIAVSSNGKDIPKSVKVVNSIRQIFQHDKFLLP